MKKTHIYFLLALTTFCLSNGYTAEIDSYTGTDEYIWSANHFIDKDINDRLKQATKQLNFDKTPCPSSKTRIKESTEEIYKVLQESLIEGHSHFFVGHFIAENYHNSIPSNKKIIIPFDESIYNQISYLDGISLKLKGTLGIIKVNGNFHLFGANYIGVDKLGHFFVEGFDFFKKAYLEEDGSLSKALSWGVSTEEGKYGLITTGVFSHADLVANFNGLRFWNQILLNHKDPLNKESSYHNSPYLKCHNDRWTLKKKFNLNRYTDAAWDEKINCNQYRNKDIEDKIMRGHSKAANKEEWKAFCPAIKSRCKTIRFKYRKYKDPLIHQNCLSL